MNPETISIPDCTLDNPVKNSSGKISFCLLPCLYKDERLQVRLPTRFKIYSHPGNGNGNDSFSLGISIPENSLEFFRDLEKHLNTLAMKKTKEVEKIGRSFARYDEGDFSLLKVDKSEQEKIYAKIYTSKLPNQDFSCRFWQLCGAKKKKPIPHPTKLINMPLRGQVVFSVKHLFCGNVKTITCIVDEVLVEEVVQSVSALMTLRIGMRRIWRVTRTFKKTFSTEKVFTQRFSAISFGSRCKTRFRKYAQGMEKIS